MTDLRVATTAEKLAELGLARGDVVLVHASLRAIGRIERGAAGLADAVREVIGDAGTVIVPAQTPNNSFSSQAYRRVTEGMTDKERRTHEQQMAGFDPARTPSFGMGAFAEYVRLRPGAVRSGHPQCSFAAWGPRAARLVRVHDHNSHLGERSPLAALDALGGKVLMLGVGYESCTALHLAEYRCRRPPAPRLYHCYVLRGGTRVRVTFMAPELDAGPFREIGAELDRSGFVRRGTVGRAETRLFPMRDAVRSAISWMDRTARGMGLVTL